MSEYRSAKSGFITSLIAAVFVAGTAVATVLIWLLGDWQDYAWGLYLTLQILWGCCIVAVAAAVLTRVTIIGWYFRRYFRPAEQPVPPPDPVAGGRPRRPTVAPWYKSGSLSFSMTVTQVALAGVAVIASTVIWIMGDVFGEGLMWLILKFIWGTWWVVFLTIVLTRVGVFRMHMLRARRAAAEKAPPEPAAEQPKPSSDPFHP